MVPVHQTIELHVTACRSTPVSYQGSAFLMGYYAGVTQVLLEKEVLVSASCSAQWLSQAAAAVLLVL